MTFFENTPYNDIWLVTSIILVLALSAVLIKVAFGSRFKFVITVAGLLLVSNLALVAQLFAFIKAYPSETEANMTWVTVLVSCKFVMLICFNQGNWIFSLQYNSVPRTVQMVLKHENNKKEQIKTWVVNLVFTVLNFIFVAMNNVSYWIDVYYNLKGSNPKGVTVASVFNVIAVIGEFILQLAISFFLAKGLYQIRQLSIDVGSEVNTKFLRIHLLTFALFLITSFIMIGFYINYILNLDNE